MLNATEPLSHFLNVKEIMVANFLNIGGFLFVLS